ncbi:pentapeptide repeat-containing protein [Oceanobacillus kapialis]|uniref:Pentapeptide repeat-containing protein n=1 Tax=Oceanobacillus kapialis TaxID=481353 RepID=A0ABW5PVV7_9BACI
MITLLEKELQSDCENCFGLCCTALPFAKSADFPFNKQAGTPCPNLQEDFKCGIHQHLREKGFKGCGVFECFGAGQKVSQETYGDISWRENSSIAEEMFEVFPVMQQLHEILYYLVQALENKAVKPLHGALQRMLDKTDALTKLAPQDLLELFVADHRTKVNTLLLQVSEMVRAQSPIKPNQKVKHDLVGAKLKGADLRGANLRGTLLLAADLRKADLRWVDFIGADMRDADIRGANLHNSIFLTQAQVNAANGDEFTKLPAGLKGPGHW